MPFSGFDGRLLIVGLIGCFVDCCHDSGFSTSQGNDHCPFYQEECDAGV